MVLRVGSVSERQLLGVNHVRGDQGDLSRITTLISYVHKPPSMSEASPDDWENYATAVEQYHADIEHRSVEFVLAHERAIRLVADALITEYFLTRQAFLDVLESLPK